MCLYMVKLRVYPVCVWLPTASSRVVFYVSDFAFFYLSPFNVSIYGQTQSLSCLCLASYCFLSCVFLRF